jgi:hypothetical protein
MTRSPSLLVDDNVVSDAILDIRTALGREPADMLFTNCRIVNVWTRQVHAASIAVRATRIVAIRPDFDGQARRVVDCGGRFALPGRIELIETASALAPSHVLLGAGITSVILEQPDAATQWQSLPVRVFTLGSGRYAAASPGAGAGTAHPVHAYAICSEAITAARELRNGTGVVLAQSISGVPVDAIVAALEADGLDTDRMMSKQLALETPARRTALPLAEPGALAAVQRATLNVAMHFALDHDVGGIAPGRRADFYLADALDGLPQSLVMNGRLLPTADFTR